MPEWYFLPFYAILRSIPDKLGGVVAMISAILILLLLPLINFSYTRSSKFRPIYAFFYWFLVSDFFLLGWIGQKPVESPFIEIGMFATLFYFLFFLFLIPAIGLLEIFLLNDTEDYVLSSEYIEDECFVNIEGTYTLHMDNYYVINHHFLDLYFYTFFDNDDKHKGMLFLRMLYAEMPSCFPPIIINSKF